MEENIAAKTEVSLPRLNEPAPDFDAGTTHGPRKLSDYKGKWLLLFSHPGDFTPVCTSEFITFSDLIGEFRSVNCELLGLSVDSTPSHLAWIRNIKEKFGVDVPFPIISDVSMKVSSTYGMIHPGASNTATVRTVFIIDDKGIMRAMIYYPLTNGRSVAEFVRLIKSLQATDQHGVSTPEGWQPGDEVIVAPPKTKEEAEARLNEGLNCNDWYYCKKNL